MDPTMNFRRDDNDDVVYYNPAAQIYVGLWCLLAGASVFLVLRLWCKITRRHGLWYDDYILIAAYVSSDHLTKPIHAYYTSSFLLFFKSGVVC